VFVHSEHLCYSHLFAIRRWHRACNLSAEREAASWFGRHELRSQPVRSAKERRRAARHISVVLAVSAPRAVVRSPHQIST